MKLISPYPPTRLDIDLQLQDLEALKLGDTERQAIDFGNAAQLLGIEFESNK